MVLLCTGSQGEPRAAMARIAEDEHPDIELDKGDLVIFSSRTIPGNERAVGQIQNRLVDLGCELVTDGDALVHVTGHPRREELKEMYAWVKPRIAIPMHGEARHLAEHAKLARAAGVERGALRPQRRHGAAGAGRGRDHRRGARRPPVPRRPPAGAERGRAGARAPLAGLCRHRHRGAGALGPRRASRRTPRSCSTACPHADAEGRPMLDIVRDAVEGTIASIPRDRRKDGEMVREAVRRAVRSAVDDAWGKRPIVKVLLTRAPR